MLGQRDQLFIIGIVDMHENKISLGRFATQIRGCRTVVTKTPQRQIDILSGIIAGVQFYRQVTFRRLAYGVPEIVIFQCLFLHIRQSLAGQELFKNRFGIFSRDLVIVDIA